MTLNRIKTELQNAGVVNSSLESMILVEHFTGIPKAKLIMMGNDEIESPLLEEAVRRRCKREPLQYIIGRWEFFGEEFIVSPDCLIPRCETEIICEKLVRELPRNGTFADLCTGSGCIAISVLKKRPDVKCAAVELFPGTLEVARKNSVLHDVQDRIELVCGDVTSDVFKDEVFDAVVSNPPYISLEEFAALEAELYFEPRYALTDGGDGLEIIRKIIEIYPIHLKGTGFMAIEIGYSQSEAVLKTAKHNHLEGEIIKDTAGLDRTIVLRKKP